MAVNAVRWLDLATPWLLEPRRFTQLRWGVLLGAGLLGAFQPLVGVGLIALAAALAALARHPSLLPLTFIAFMGNTKFNLYLGFVTVFPEYVPILLGLGLAAFRWAERPHRLTDTRFLWGFAALTFAGLLSATFALEIRPVLTRALLIPVAGLVFWWVVVRIRDREQLARALVVLQWGTALGATFGVAQMVGIAVFKRNIDLGFLREIGNPEFEYSVGAPVLHQLTSTFRANGLFNDPNIFAGYLAAMLPILAALALGPWAGRSRSRFAGAWGTLAVSTLALILTLSRSGFLAAAVGLAVVLGLRPEWLRAPRLWVGLGALLSGAIAAASIAGVQVVLILVRLASSFASHDVSARTHERAFVFAWELFTRYPLTGVGLRNFGQHYGREVEPGATAMMAHNAFVGWLAETGVIGGAVLLALLVAVVGPPVRAMRDPTLHARDPELHALLAGALGAIAALLVTNIFYDFWLRTFVWVTLGLAVVIGRLASAERRMA